jgi:transposase InsO family protein
VHEANYGVYGPRKVWLALNRAGVPVARCTVERLMRELQPTGVRRGKRVVTTRPDVRAVRPADLVQRGFRPAAPNRLWVADYTYVSTWSGMVYVAFVIDAYARRASTSMRTALVLDTIEQAIWTRRRDGITDLTGLVHHTDAGSPSAPPLSLAPPAAPSASSDPPSTMSLSRPPEPSQQDQPSTIPGMPRSPVSRLCSGLGGGRRG